MPIETSKDNQNERNNCYRPLFRHDPEELQRLADRPQNLVPLPSGANWRLLNLAQYRGRTPEGNRRSLSNIARQVKIMAEPAENLPVVLPSGAVAPPAPPAPSPMDQVNHQTARSKFLRLRMTLPEQKLYNETWDELILQHPDYTAFDKMDLHTLCMETVIQFRIEGFRDSNFKKLSKLDMQAYNDSFKRMEQARKNLASRRSDAAKAPVKGNVDKSTNIQIALMHAQSRLAPVQDQRVIGEEKFFEGTNTQKSIDEMMKQHDDAQEEKE